jgi:hypothetical protein
MIGKTWLWCEGCELILCKYCYRSDDHSGQSEKEHKVRGVWGWGGAYVVRCGMTRPPDSVLKHVMVALTADTPKLMGPTFVELEGIHCEYIFRKGDIIWRCYTCEQEPDFFGTSCLCQICFVSEEHEGHSIESHEASGKDKAFCDCGNPASWKPKAKKLQQPCGHRVGA